MDKCPYCEKEIADVAKELIIQESDVEISGIRFGVLCFVSELVCPHCNHEVEVDIETEPRFRLSKKE